jgi:hypothetical protein
MISRRPTDLHLLDPRQVSERFEPPDQVAEPVTRHETSDVALRTPVARMLTA